MTSSNNSLIEIASAIVDDRVELTVEDICHSCQVDNRIIVEYVEHGIVEPKSRQSDSWRFSAVVLPRIAQALRLQRDFELNSAGVALALDLLSEIDVLKNRLNRPITGGE